MPAPASGPRSNAEAECRVDWMPKVRAVGRADAWSGRPLLEPVSKATRQPARARLEGALEPSPGCPAAAGWLVFRGTDRTRSYAFGA